MSQPRAVFSLPREGEEPLQVVVRCIEDLMATESILRVPRKIQSALAAIAADAADLIIAAHCQRPDPAVVTHNGTVVSAATSFIHDGNPDSHADPEHNLIDDRVAPSSLQRLLPCRVQSGRNRQRLPALLPRRRMQLSRRPTSRIATRVGKERHLTAVNISVIGNVTDYGSYDTIGDAQALN